MDDSRPADPAAPCVVSCETLTGGAVVNPAGEELGLVERILIDVPSGKIAFAVLGCGGVFGIGAKRYAIPWSELKLDRARECLVLDISPERLESEAVRVE